MEPPEASVARVQEVLKYLPPERRVLNPDCGVGPCARRPLNTPETVARKLAAMAAAAILRA